MKLELYAMNFNVFINSSFDVKCKKLCFLYELSHIKIRERVENEATPALNNSGPKPRL